MNSLRMKARARRKVLWTLLVLTTVFGLLVGAANAGHGYSSWFFRMFRIGG